VKAARGLGSLSLLAATGCNALEGAARGGGAFVGALLSIFGVLALGSLFLAVLAIVWVRRRSLLGVAVISWCLMLTHLIAVVLLVEGAPTSSGLLPWYLRVVAGTSLLPVAAAACTTSLALVQLSARRLGWVTPLVVVFVVVMHGSLLWRFILDRDPLAALSSAPVVEVKIGTEHGCSLHEDGSVMCWGLNDDSQLGDGTRQTVDWPVMVPGIFDAVSLAVGDGRTCVRRYGGVVECWGRGADGSVTELPTPIAGAIIEGPWFAGNRVYAIEGSGLLVSGEDSMEPLVPLPPVAQIAAGLRHVCIRVGAGSVSCWGDRSRGQLGEAMKVTRGAPTKEDDGPRRKLDTRVILPGVDDAAELVAGDHHTCALRHGGAVVCWGLRDEGGRACRDGCASPGLVDIEGIEDAVGISAGAGHTCVVRQAGAVMCWGDNRWGQLGQGSLVPVKGVVLVPLVERATGVFANGYSTCATLESGGAQCWGASRSGSLGVGVLQACRARDALASNECATEPQPLRWLVREAEE